MKPLFKLDDRYHGNGAVLFAWQPLGAYLATCGKNGLVHIFDRHGGSIQEITLDSVGLCTGLEWDSDGEILAIMQEGVTIVSLYEVASQRVTPLETSQKFPSFIKWATSSPCLAIGTDKGNLLIYRKDNRKKIPIMGRHSRAILSGTWSKDNKLYLGGSDNTLSITTMNGDSVDQMTLNNEPISIEFASARSDQYRDEAKKTTSDRTLSANLGGQTILLHNFNDSENPIELSFEEKLGEIVTYKWFGDGYLMIGFAQGFLVVSSTKPSEIGSEIKRFHLFKDGLNDVSYSMAVSRAAACGDNSIKILENRGGDWSEIKSDATFLDISERNKLNKVAWTEDGQILTVSSKSGTVYNYLAKMPTVHASCGFVAAYLSSLKEITIINAVDESIRPVVIQVDVEPAFAALGPRYVAVGMNNHIWYYLINSNSKSAVLEKEMLSTVNSVKLNSVYAAVLCSGVIYLHAIAPENDRIPEARVSMNFPEREDLPKITCLSLTSDFLIYGTEAGTINYFHLAEWRMLAGSEYRHSCGIADISTNLNATRVAFIDKAHNGFLYNPVDSNTLPIPTFSPSVKCILWDPVDWGVFIAIDDKEICTYIYSPVTLYGPQISKLGNLVVRPNGDMAVEPEPTPLPPGFSPIIVYNGVVTCQNPDGAVDVVKLASHIDVLSKGRGSLEKQQKCFCQNLALLRFDYAWDIAKQLKIRPLLLALSGKAMEQLNIKISLLVYRELSDAGMVMALEDIVDIEDKNLLAGHVAVLFSDYALAQELFLTSSNPVSALEMRCDLLHWEHALKLSSTLAPEKTPEILLNFAQQLEFQEDYTSSLHLYENAVNTLKTYKNLKNSDSQALSKCKGGVARMTLRLGDLRRGLSLVLENDDKNLTIECASILEGLKQFQDAALLYEKGEMFEKAASIYIQTKNFDDAEPLMKNIVTPKLHNQFAKAMEAGGKYEKAMLAYEHAKDPDSVIRICLEHLNQPQKAFELVRVSNSSEGARLAAKYCQDNGNIKGAIEFLFMSNCVEEAFELSKTHSEMESFAGMLKEDGTTQQYIQIATYYEGKSDWSNAANFYSLCNNYSKALKYYLQSGEKDIGKAIELVGKAKSEILTHTLVDFLTGETDGITKDPNYIFHLYMALGNYPQAARTAIIIARQEQEVGNYKVAHDMLLKTSKDLEEVNIRVPFSLSRSLLLLHSYTLVKKLIKLQDHLGAARMLIRVSNNISKFPASVVPILTSTVIECHRAKLKLSSFEFAKKLMAPEFRSKVDENYKRKIDNIVRKPPAKDEELVEENTPCPYCKAVLPESELECKNCKNYIPYCATTGYHVLFDDYSSCIKCKFPSRYSSLKEYVKAEGSCPMCDEALKVEDVKKIEDPTAELQKLAAGETEDNNGENSPK